jgi:hypothetical protein
MPDVSTVQQPKQWQMTLYRGDSWPKYAFTIRDGNGNYRDLSNAQVLMQVRTAPDAPTILKTISRGAGFDVGGYGNATVTFNTTVDLPLAAADQPLVADIQVTYQSGEVKELEMIIPLAEPQ